MKKYLVLVMFISLFLVSACSNGNKVSFKEDYESINGQENAKGKIHRVVTIPADNVFSEVDAIEIIKMIENNETFYVYFGSRLCPWCRSVIESACKVANIRGISKIYYVDIWDDDGNEILRDKYVLDSDNKPILEKEATNDYKKLLSYFADYLRNYTLDDSEGNSVDVGEKRIYAPNFMFIDKGKLKKLVNGKSDKLTDSRGELTEEIKKDQEKIFDVFFTEVCSDEC